MIHPGPPRRFGDTFFMVVVIAVFALVIVWFVYHLMQGLGDQTSTLKPHATAFSIALLSIKVFWPLGYGSDDPVALKWKSLGADLAFASVTYDVTMYAGQFPVPVLQSIGVKDYTPFYFYLGGVTLLLWALWFYPKTCAVQKPSEAMIRWCTFGGLVLYFGRIYLYLMR